MIVIQESFAVKEFTKKYVGMSIFGEITLDVGILTSDKSSRGIRVFFQVKFQSESAGGKDIDHYNNYINYEIPRKVNLLIGKFKNSRRVQLAFPPTICKEAAMSVSAAFYKRYKYDYASFELSIPINNTTEINQILANARENTITLFDNQLCSVVIKLIQRYDPSFRPKVIGGSYKQIKPKMLKLAR